jgi:ubiquinone/menaquinone biosynthesis C-methylase UbiE
LTQQDVRLSEWRWQEQYSTDERLRARIETHERYSELREPWPAWVANQLPHPLPGPLLDAGAGNGAIFLAVAPRIPAGSRAVAFDLSPGMLAACRTRAQAAGIAHAAFANGNIEALPFAGNTFGLAMANHMLYHVPDIPRAVAGLRRVLRPGGIFLATTGSRDDYAEMLALHGDGVRATGLPLDPRQDDGVITRFSLENGANYIAPYFPDVELRKREDALLLPTVEAFMRFYLSAWIYSGASGPDDPRVPPGGWNALAEWVAARAGALIARAGVFRMRKTAGAFIARK